MRSAPTTSYMGSSPESSHLCVLVHGLLGKPSRMANIEKSLRSRFAQDKLYILLAKGNTGGFTYDGIDCGGERLCAEIEEQLRNIESKGGRVKKLSLIGYSFGGLVLRYAVGLLEAKGVLDKVQCMNFVTFATPHLGVRTAMQGWRNRVWDAVGARVFSASGQQLFVIDDFRDTGRPLLSLLVDSKSAFMSGIRKFTRHILYANVVNDRSAAYYTTSIETTDPFADMNDIQVNYLAGYKEVILDPYLPFLPREIAAFLLISVIQTVRSSGRISLHDRGEAGIDTASYRAPILGVEINEDEQLLESVHDPKRYQKRLGSIDEESIEQQGPLWFGHISQAVESTLPQQGNLILGSNQVEMVESLNKLKWRKYPVWIQRTRLSHAAIIVRTDTSEFDEGKAVLKHFVDEFIL
ncbi:hypothetical protein N3K66_009063 [Trichothecium roseum]|uniref:Uncharacterized protein n=1 Tax=Trichothecium roseum TaxID=47278 RepID=A0ACC0UR57_9HYPO|nr:hypothetical protein N3K66_009063 [Trichothecium roseum]